MTSPRAAMWQHVDRWDYPSARAELSGGPERVSEEPAPDGFRPPHVVGFTLPTPPIEPLTWEGDGA